MPRRTKVDRTPIVEAFKRTGHIGRAAELAGVHYNTAVQVIRLFKGKCMRCGQRRHLKGQTKCRSCANWEKKRTADKRADARKRGCCTCCPKPLKSGSALFCEDCHAKAFIRQRFHRINITYGKDGWTAWQRAGEKCEVCGAPNEISETHIHHIDQDRSNNDISNFICLCNHCHLLTHSLLKSPGRWKLVAWFKKTYPDKL